MNCDWDISYPYVSLLHRMGMKLSIHQNIMRATFLFCSLSIYVCVEFFFKVGHGYEIYTNWHFNKRTFMNFSKAYFWETCFVDTPYFLNEIPISLLQKIIFKNWHKSSSLKAPYLPNMHFRNNGIRFDVGLDLFRSIMDNLWSLVNVFCLVWYFLVESIE